MGEFVEVIVKGVREAKADIRRMDLKTDRAAVAGLQAVQAYGVKMVRSKLRGSPRWGRRGRSRIWEQPVDLGFEEHPRSGGPGRFTGHLAKGVGKVKRPKRVGDAWHGGVGIGGKSRNVYKTKNEAKYPYFAPAMKQTEAAALPLWEKAFKRIMDK